MSSVAMALLLVSLATVESNNNPDAVSPNGNEVGILQITPIMVRDCNRIVGEERWDLDDRLDIIQSYEMAETFFDHYCKGASVEQMARCWNGGPRGHVKSSTEAYWIKVRAEMEARADARSN